MGLAQAPEIASNPAKGRAQTGFVPAVVVRYISRR